MYDTNYIIFFAALDVCLFSSSFCVFHAAGSGRCRSYPLRVLCGAVFLSHDISRQHGGLLRCPRIPTLRTGARGMWVERSRLGRRGKQVRVCMYSLPRMGNIFTVFFPARSYYCYCCCFLKKATRYYLSHPLITYDAIMLGWYESRLLA